MVPSPSRSRANQGVAAVEILVGVFLEAIETDTPWRVKTEAADNLLLYLQKIVKEVGPDQQTFIGLLESVFGRLAAYPEEPFFLFVKSYYQIKRLAHPRLHSPIYGLMAEYIVGLQAYEYVHAYQDLNLKLTSGIYGSTFFMLTGFHGMHVTIGAIMLATIFFRVMKGHFTPEKHFAFEAVAWYWHFVDVVWIGLYVFVYWM